jgi:hypothetical protein
MVKNEKQSSERTREQGFTNSNECAIMIHGDEGAMMEQNKGRSDATFCSENCLNEVKGVRKMQLIKTLSLNESTEASKVERDVTIKIDESTIRIKFTQKPAPAVLDWLKQHGYRWDTNRKEWWQQVEIGEVLTEEEKKEAIEASETRDILRMFELLTEEKKREKALARVEIETLMHELMQMLQNNNITKVIIIDTVKETIEVWG